MGIASTHDGYPSGKFGGYSFSRFGSIVWTADKQTHTDGQADADERFNPATLVGVRMSNCRLRPMAR